jgi:hypothetical protein
MGRRVEGPQGCEAPESEAQGAEDRAQGLEGKEGEVPTEDQVPTTESRGQGHAREIQDGSAQAKAHAHTGSVPPKTARKAFSRPEPAAVVGG